MSFSNSSLSVARAARQVSSNPGLCTCFTNLSIRSRSVSSTTIRYATPTLHPTTTRDQSLQSKSAKGTSFDASKPVQPPSYKDLTPAQRAARAAERARIKLQEQQQKYSSARKLGGLSDNSFFADKDAKLSVAEQESTALVSDTPSELAQRSLENMSFAINPRPNARARWQRKMLIRHVRRRGRLTKEMIIARTERNHTSKSFFFKTSMKKLAPLARQISGKSIDEAILQMRFSKKKAAKEVRAHLIQARNEAIVMKGMGLESPSVKDAAGDTESPVATDPGIAPPLPHQNPTKSTKSGLEKSPTDIYVAQAWVNRGPYGMEPEYRARGRVNILRPPWTGISVMLKEEKTRSREKADKEAKAIRKRLSKNMWLQLPDRPIVRQSQYVLW